jgi:hypothetical protein
MRTLMGRAASVLALSAWLTGCGMSCGPVEEGSPDPRCPTCYLSKVDNPVIRNALELKERSGPRAGLFSFETAERDSDGVRYGQVLLTTRVRGGNRGRGSIEDDLPALPPMQGFWSAAEGEERMPWEARGAQIGYAAATVDTEVLDAFGVLAEHTPLVPLEVALDPSVMLVPVQVIRVIPPPQTTFFDYLRHFTQEVYKELFDRRLVLRTFRGSHPDEQNAWTSHLFWEAYKPPPGEGLSRLSYAPPDEIWRQCGIQFRMIDCPGTDLGCPDLNVDSEKSVAPDNCEQGVANFSTMRGNRRLAVALPGVRDDLPIVLTVRRVSFPCVGADVVDLADTGNGTAWIGLQYQLAQQRYVVAHELGHVLSLRDDDECTEQRNHLMCSNTAFQRAFIRPEDCLRARVRAADFVDRMWKVRPTP